MFSMHNPPTRLLALVVGIAASAAAVTWISTEVLGLAAAVGAFTLATLFELVRMALATRRNQLAKLWPQIFDSCYSAQAAGVPMAEQVRELTERGPERLRPSFKLLEEDLESLPVNEALRRFQGRERSREADLFATLFALNHELGGRGQRGAWREAGRHLRESLKLAGEIATKQGWIIGSAKMALFAPWLIAGVLMQLGDNRAAFASMTGTAVLLFGLALSAVGYFLVNLLGKLPEQPRVLYAR